MKFILIYNRHSVRFVSCRREVMNSKIDEAVNGEKMHHMDGDRWIFKQKFWKKYVVYTRLI